MTVNSLEFLFIVYQVCIVLSVLTFLITLFFIVPLQMKKAGVKNGLQSLRQKLLIKGMLSLLMSAITIMVLTSRFFVEGEIIRFLNTLLIFLFSAFWLVRAIIESSIYHTQFTDDQIQLHQKIFKEEVRQEKKIETARVKLNSDRRRATRDRHKLD